MPTQKVSCQLKREDPTTNSFLHLIQRLYRCRRYTTHATRPATTFSPSLSSPRVPGLLRVEDWGNLPGTGPGESRAGIPGHRHSTGNGALRGDPGDDEEEVDTIRWLGSGGSSEIYLVS